MNKKITSLILSGIIFLQMGIMPTIYANDNTDIQNNSNNSASVDKPKQYGKYVAAGAVGIAAAGAIILACMNKKLNLSVSPEEYPGIAKEYRNYRESREEGQKYKGRKIPFNDLKNMCNQVTDILKREQKMHHNVPEIKGPTIVVGDLHGDFEAAKFYYDEFKNSPSDTSIVFLGDYIDRGPNSIEILALLFQLKISFPKRVHLLCGNHERMDYIDTMRYKNSLNTECQDKYPDTNTFNMLWNTFKQLPLAAIVKTNNGDTLCAHGGIPFKLVTKTETAEEQITTLECINKTSRATEVLDYISITNSNDLSIPFYIVNGRFGNQYSTKIKEFLKENKLTRIVRGHDHDIAADQHGVDVVKLGDNDDDNYEFITLISSPNFLINHCPNVKGSHPHSGAAILIDNENIVHISTITQSFLGK